MKNKKIYYNEVNSFEVNKFDPLTDFNGWGVRKSKRYGTGYITDTDKIMTLDINGTLISFSIKNDTNVKEIMSKYVNKNIN